MRTSFSNPLTIPVLGFCAYSGTGKTTLLTQLIPELTTRGIRLAVIKHAHHTFDVDVPGKDSYEMRHAGAHQVLVASHVRWALMTEDKTSGDPQLAHLLAQIEADKVDVVLVEGFKKLALPKIELHRAALGKPFIHTQDDNVLAVACCEATQLPQTMKQLDLNNIKQIADFVESYIKNYQPKTPEMPINCACELDHQQQLSVAQGINHILSVVTPINDTQAIALDELDHRVLAENILSPIDVPQQNNSAMDGYAFASQSNTNNYQIIADVLAGHNFVGELKPGQAVRIMTGAPLPQGADVVVPKELTEETDDWVYIRDKFKLGQHIRLAGEDIAQGAIALTQGRRIYAAEQGLLASLGMAQAKVYRRPVIAVFSTGDEVCQPGTKLKTNCIYDSNRYTIKAMVRRLGCDLIDLGIIADDQAQLERTLIEASDKADVIISSGGVSVGNADFIKIVLAKIGQINFWRINMRPGRPLAFGQINQALFFGLPGNPVATMVSMLQFVQPALRKLAGEVHWQASWLPAIADEPLRSRIGRTEFLRGVSYIAADGQLHVGTTGSQGSGILTSMSQGNCLIIIGEHDEQVNIGSKVYIQSFADLL